MTSNEKEFVRLIGVYTARRFCTWQLAGQSKASCRADIMSALHGARVPQSKAGVTVIESAVHSLFDTQGRCIAARESDLIRKINAAGFDVDARVLDSFGSAA